MCTVSLSPLHHIAVGPEESHLPSYFQITFASTWTQDSIVRVTAPTAHHFASNHGPQLPRRTRLYARRHMRRGCLRRGMVSRVVVVSWCHLRAGRRRGTMALKCIPDTIQLCDTQPKPTTCSYKGEYIVVAIHL